MKNEFVNGWEVDPSIVYVFCGKGYAQFKFGYNQFGTASFDLVTNSNSLELLQHPFMQDVTSETTQEELCSILKQHNFSERKAK